MPLFQLKVWFFRLRMFNLRFAISKLIWRIRFTWKYRTLTPQWKAFQSNDWGAKFKRDNAEALKTFHVIEFYLPPVINGGKGEN